MTTDTHTYSSPNAARPNPRPRRHYEHLLSQAQQQLVFLRRRSIIRLSLGRCGTELGGRWFPFRQITPAIFWLHFRSRRGHSTAWRRCPDRTAHSSSPRPKRLPSSRCSYIRSHAATWRSRPACSCLQLCRKQGPQGPNGRASQPAAWPRLAEACGSLRPILTLRRASKCQLAEG